MFPKEEIGLSTEWRVVAAGAKVSPAILPVVTHLSPLTHKFKMVWPHRIKQGKDRHLNEGTWTDLLQGSITHSGVSKLPVQVCKETSLQQTMAATMSFCSPMPWGMVVPTGKKNANLPTSQSDSS